MKINIISNYRTWKRQGQDLDGEAINLPASISAYLELEKDNKRMVTTSELLAKEDYQEVWRETYLTVWRMVKMSLLDDAADRPNIILIHAYSIYLLIAEISILEKALEKYSNENKIDELRIEDPNDFSNSATMFWHGSAPGYYHEVAREWAKEKNIKLKIVRRDAGDRAFACTRGASKRFLYELARHPVSQSLKICRLINDICVWPVFSIIRNILYVARGGRQIVFYLPFSFAGMRKVTPGYVVSIDPVIDGLMFFKNNFCKKDSKANYCCGDMNFSYFEVEMDKIGRKGQIVKRKFAESLQRNCEKGKFVFSVFSAILKKMVKTNFEIGFISAGINMDFSGHYSAYIAEAFKKSGHKVAGASHGGNTRLIRKAGTPSLIVDYMGDIFFQWGNGSSDEHIEYGIKRNPRFVSTGFPGRKDLLRKKGALKLWSGNIDKPKIIYAPTILGLETTIGQNIAWDRYIYIFQEVCKILNQPGLDCTVKIWKNHHANFVDFSRLPYLRIVEQGGFSDYMWNADYIITDSLGSSPIYEALFTDKPILLYAGIENQVWDENFLEQLKKRVICFWDKASYLNGLKEFAEDPKKYVLRAGPEISSALVDEYMPGVSQEKFWSIIYETFFEENGKPKNGLS